MSTEPSSLQKLNWAIASLIHSKYGVRYPLPSFHVHDEQHLNLNATSANIAHVVIARIRDASN
eukprot:1069550-Amphidinium_carterae.1